MGRTRWRAAHGMLLAALVTTLAAGCGSGSAPGAGRAAATATPIDVPSSGPIEVRRVVSMLTGSDCPTPPRSASPDVAVVACDRNGTAYQLGPARVVGGVTDADAGQEDVNGSWQVSVSFDDAASKQLAALTGELAGDSAQQLALARGGQVIAIAAVMSPIEDGHMQVAGLTKAQAVQLASYLEAGATSAETATASGGPSDTTQQPTAPTVDGDVRLVTSEGFTYTLHVEWRAGQPHTDVGSEPPGKTDVLWPASPYRGSVTNTTVGGRSMPESALAGDLYLVALYPSRSPVCTYVGETGFENSLLFAGGASSTGGAIRTKGFCGVKLFPVIGQAWSGGALDLGHLENRVPVDFTLDDLAWMAGIEAATDLVAQDPDDGPSWLDVREGNARSVVAALSKPVAFAVQTFDLKPRSRSCSYPNQVSGEAQYLALIDSNVGTEVPGC